MSPMRRAHVRRWWKDDRRRAFADGKPGRSGRLMLARLDDIAAQATARSLEDTLAELETLPASTARALAFDAVDALLQLYGEGLARTVAAHHDGRLSDDFLGRDAVLS